MVHFQESGPHVGNVLQPSSGIVESSNSHKAAASDGIQKNDDAGDLSRGGGSPRRQMKTPGPAFALLSSRSLPAMEGCGEATALL